MIDIKVEKVGDNNVLTINYSDNNPAKYDNILNAVDKNNEFNTEYSWILPALKRVYNLGVYDGKAMFTELI